MKQSNMMFQSQTSKAQRCLWSGNRSIDALKRDATEYG